MAQRLSVGLASSMLAPLCRRSQPEEPRTRPAGPGDLARHLGERAVARAAQQYAVGEPCYAMADPVPFTDQHAARRDPSAGRLGWCSPMTVIFGGTFEQATGRGFEAAKNS